MRARCQHCNIRRVYDPGDLKQLVGDVDIEGLRRQMRCEKCGMELLRKRKPPAHLMCARCRKALAVFEVVEMREVEPALAAHRKG